MTAITEREIAIFTKVWLQISPHDHVALCQHSRNFQSRDADSTDAKVRHFRECMRLAARAARRSLEKTQIVDVESAWQQLDIDSVSSLPNAAGALKTELEAHRSFVGERVRKVRHARGLTQAQLAEKASLTQAHVSQIEAGSLCITYQTLAKIAVALHVAMYDLDCSFDDAGQRIQSLRLSKGWTTSELGRSCRISHERVEQIESGGGAKISDRELGSIARVFETTEDDLDPTYSARRRN